MSKIALALSVVALVLGGSGLGLALTAHAATGPTGPQGAPGGKGIPGQNGTVGPSGPAGPGTLEANSTKHPFALFNATNGCWNTNPPEVNITVPAPGKVVVEAWFVASWGHSAGVTDELAVYVTNSTACTGAPYYVVMSGSDPSGGFQQSGSWEQTFSVRAGVNSFYVLAYVVGGTDSVEFWTVEATAVFYPS